jgi:hypothetical protein
MSDGRVGKPSPRHHAHRKPVGGESDRCASAGSIGFSFHMRSQRDVMAKTACMADKIIHNRAVRRFRSQCIRKIVPYLPVAYQ